MSVASVLTRNDGNAPPANGRVRQWLSRAGLGEYRDAFARTAEREFTALGMVDFQNFGVVDVAHKQTLFRLIKNLQNAEGAVCESDDAQLPSRVKHMALVDVHAAEHDELLLSPLLRPNTSATQKSPFAPSPADDKEANETKHETTLPDDKRADSPLEQLRRLSRERHGAVGQAAANAGETLNDARFSRNESVSEDANKSASSRESASPPDPAKTPFVASPSVFLNHAERLVDANPHLPLAPLPADQPRIRVVVRKRPLNAKELAREEEDVVTVDRRSSAETTSCETRASCVTVWEPKTKVDLTQYTEEHAFNFDDVFDPEASNDEVYRATIAPLVGTTFDKCKVTCFAYGQTGSGKTYTMNPLPIRAAGEILGELERRRRTSETATADGSSLRLHVSFFEIYGGKVYDLLNGRARLVIREDARAQMCVVGLKEFEVADVGLVEQLIAHGTAARCVGSTGANAESSRSHAIMQFVLKKSAADESGSESGPARRVPASVVAQRLKTKAGANHETIHGKFSFIDLAGSERGADTSENDRQTRLEGAEINKSLLALKECIRALDRGNGHVPFRGSKLTEVLRDSFMGNSRTVMIANVSPASGSCEHTLNTLRYAYRVKELRDDAKKSTDHSLKKKDARDARFAADGVTPVGPPPPPNERTERTERTTNEQRAAVEKTEKTSGGGSASAFDPRAAARAAAARVRDATRRSADAEAERLAEKKRGAAAFLTKGGGGGGGGLGYSAGLLSPRGRKERPKSAMPLHGARGIASARAAATGAKSVSGSPTKDADGRRTAGVGAKARARPQTAQTRSGVSGSLGLGPGARRSLAPRAERPDPRVTAFDPDAERDARVKKPFADPPDSTPETTDGERKPPPPIQSTARTLETNVTVDNDTPSGSFAVPATKTLRPLRGSALAAAKARAHLAGGPPADQAEMVAAHDDLINVILEEEEAVIAAHRAQIENAMALVKREMALLAEVDKPGSAIDAYVERLAEVLEQKQKGVESLRDAVRAFQTHLKEEEVLSKAVGLH